MQRSLHMCCLFCFFTCFDLLLGNKQPVIFVWFKCQVLIFTFGVRTMNNHSLIFQWSFGFLIFATEIEYYHCYSLTFIFTSIVLSLLLIIWLIMLFFCQGPGSSQRGFFPLCFILAGKVTPQPEVKVPSTLQEIRKETGWLERGTWLRKAP